MATTRQEAPGRLTQHFPPIGQQDDSSIDIIAIHGLGTTSPLTWEAHLPTDAGGPNATINWLSHHDMLPTAVPLARIFTFSWNSRYYEDAPVVRILDVAEVLLNRIESKRGKALEIANVSGSRYRKLLLATSGVVFLASPLQGSRAATAAQWRVMLAGILGRQPSYTLLQDLDGGTKALYEVSARFATMLNNPPMCMQTMCFWETQASQLLNAVFPTWATGWLAGWLASTSTVLVEKDSACLMGRRHMPLDAKHVMMNKFCGPDDPNYESVRDAIVDMVENSITVVASQVQSDRNKILPSKSSRVGPSIKGSEAEPNEYKLPAIISIILVLIVIIFSSTTARSLEFAGATSLGWGKLDKRLPSEDSTETTCDKEEPTAVHRMRPLRQIAMVDHLHDSGPATLSSPSQPSPLQSLLGLPTRILHFPATEFYFRHQPESVAESWKDFEPDGRVGKQYFYKESWNESRAAWSPLYVQGLLRESRMSPYVLIPDFDGSDLPSDLNGPASERFEMDEQVLTCRRICTLYGRLDLFNSGRNTFPPISLAPASYKIRWRVQFFNTRPRASDKSATTDGRDATPDWNPMRFPLWPDHTAPSYPGHPVLRFSAGYSASLVPPAWEHVVTTRGHARIADQLLRPHEAVPDMQDANVRLEVTVSMKDYIANCDKGWLYIESPGRFAVLANHHPVFIVSAEDDGGWIGGFRFGGVDLITEELHATI